MRLYLQDSNILVVLLLIVVGTAICNADKSFYEISHSILHFIDRATLKYYNISFRLPTPEL